MARKSKGGRPPKMTPAVIAKLEDAWTQGFTDAQACFRAEIDEATLYRYCQANPGFSDRKERLKEMRVIKAKENTFNALKDGDKRTSRWELEKRDPAYKTQSPQAIVFADNIRIAQAMDTTRLTEIIGGNRPKLVENKGNEDRQESI